MLRIIMEEKIIQLLRAGPKTMSQLISKLECSKATAYKHALALANSRKIYMLPMLRNGKWVSLFCLPEHLELAIRECGYLPADYIKPLTDSRIREAIQKLRFKLFRNPELEEAALELGIDPANQEFKSKFYAAASGLGWSPPSPMEKLMGDSKRARIISIARILKSGIHPRSYSELEIQEAKRYMEAFPEEI